MVTAIMGWALDELCERAEEEVRNGCNIIILSDRRASADRVPIPVLLACAAVHHHLIRNGLRTSVGMKGCSRQLASHLINVATSLPTPMLI